jgi:putative ABC transport system permease protein
MSLSRFFRRRQWDEERARELDAYLEITMEENIARGMSPEQARDAARKKLGNRTQIREEIYRMNTFAFVESIFHDLRYGARLLRLNPGFALVAIASLALGIGANTAMFQLIDSVRLRTLPVKDPQQLAEVQISNFKGARGNFTGWHSEFNNPLWEYFRDHQDAFTGVFAFARRDFNISPSGEERHAQGLYVSGNLFRELGVLPAMGRVFDPAEDRRGCGSPGVVISDAFWKREFGGAQNVIGKKLTLDGHPFEVIGVTPAGFSGLEVGRSFDAAVLICSESVLRQPSRLDVGHEWWLTVMGRVRPGWSFEKTTANLVANSAPIFQATLPPEYPAKSIRSISISNWRRFRREPVCPTFVRRTPIL